LRLGDVKNLVESTADAAFAVDSSGLIVAWNNPAEVMFGLQSSDAIGKACGQIVRGMDECGMVCSEDCSVLRATRQRHPLPNFDLQVQTPEGRKWCNLSVLMVGEGRKAPSYTIHIVRPVDVSKKLEMLVRDFVVSETHLPREQAAAMISSTRTPDRETDLTSRVKEVLSMLAKGVRTAGIAEQLHISRTTVSNHVQHIMRKLGAHSRLEAIRRAEHAGLI